jgi:hypothetical protein
MLTYRTEWTIWNEDGLDYTDEEIEVSFEAYDADPEVGPAGIEIEINEVKALSGRPIRCTAADERDLRLSIRENWEDIVARESGY